MFFVRYANRAPVVIMRVSSLVTGIRGHQKAGMKQTGRCPGSLFSGQRLAQQRPWCRWEQTGRARSWEQKGTPET
jgi:hypothetical protein